MFTQTKTEYTFEGIPSFVEVNLEFKMNILHKYIITITLFNTNAYDYINHWLQKHN